ncbi:ATP-binding protein [Aerophototrophica crusticola]|uniref:ATP-binding protein n=1 Tax=Aerophototrophica crusticola TaxID=1709002 RepID=A0A858R455_9PROT|nr:ATP-binding protein [Rhodospirillaceae bacterium B3]
MDGSPRIGITGSAGTGKTTLAEALAGALGVPLVPEAMRALLKAGFDFHSLTREGHRALIRQQADDLAAVLARDKGGLVTDRTPLDFAAFWLANGYQVDDEPGTEALLARAVAAMADFTLVVVTPWGELPLGDDGVRSRNPWHQLQFQELVEGLCRRWLPPTACCSCRRGTWGWSAAGIWSWGGWGVVSGFPLVTPTYEAL